VSGTLLFFAFCFPHRRHTALGSDLVFHESKLKTIWRLISTREIPLIKTIGGRLLRVRRGRLICEGGSEVSDSLTSGQLDYSGFVSVLLFVDHFMAFFVTLFGSDILDALYMEQLGY
jgi:hypothetical protein